VDAQHWHRSRFGSPGGITGRDEIKSAGDIAVAGLDVNKYLKMKDQTERLIYQAIAKNVIERQTVRDHNLAVKISEQVGKLLGAK
jgi:hypothetical protein